MIIASFTKDPTDIFDATVDFGRWLAEGETVISATALAHRRLEDGTWLDTTGTVLSGGAQASGTMVGIRTMHGAHGERHYIAILAITSTAQQLTATVDMLIKQEPLLV